MMNDLKVKININQIFTEFFQLRDWKARSFGIGGIYLLIVTLGVMVTTMVFLFGLGEILLAFLLMFISILFLFVVLFLFQFYLAGYKLDLIKVMQKNEEVESVGYLTDFTSRVTQGFKLNMSLWAYILIPTLIILVGSLVSSLSTPFVDATSNSFGAEYWFFLITANSISAFGTFLQFLTRLLIYPLVTARFVNNDYRIADSINMSQVLNTLRSNIKELLVVGGLIFLAQTIVMVAIYMSAFFILLCLGLFLFPIAVAVGTVYIQHFEARMVTSMLNSSIVKSE